MMIVVIMTYTEVGHGHGQGQGEGQGHGPLGGHCCFLLRFYYYHRIFVSNDFWRHHTATSTKGKDIGLLVSGPFLHPSIFWQCAPTHSIIILTTLCFITLGTSFF